jgi:hypothetical protein
MHLLIPLAYTGSAAGQQALTALDDAAWPTLRQLLARLTVVHRDDGDDYTLSPPHERALARAQGWTVADGQLPLAAQAAQEAGLDFQRDAWAFVTPCHWRVGADQMVMSHTDALALQEDESRALMAAMQPYFAEDGITLHYDQPERWLAHSPVFAGLATASLDRAMGRNVNAWMPEGPQAAPLRRLQNEMQMLMYTHPLNDQRAERGLPPVNSVWLSGSGAFQPAQGEVVTLAPALREAALREDWPGWQQAWRALDAGEIAHALALAEQGGECTLTLCGERSALTLAQQPLGWTEKAKRLFSPLRPRAVLEQL